MKLYAAVLPLLVFLTFGYTNSVLLRTSDHGTKKLTVALVKAEVKADLAKFHPNNTVIINK